MKRDIDLIELLCLWHKRMSNWTPVEGYPRECPSTSGFKGSRQFDDVNGQQEAEFTSRLVARLDGIIRSIEEPYQSALCLLARNKASGISVWVSPRLPADKDARAVVVARALELFAGEL